MNPFVEETWTRLYYQMTRDMVDQSGTKLTRTIFTINWLIGAYATRLLYLSFVLNYDWAREGLQPYWARKYDIFFDYMLDHRDRYDSFILNGLYAFELFNLVCQSAMFRVNARFVTWQWWYQLVVANQDQYYQKRLANSKIDKIRLAYRDRLRQRARHRGWLARTVFGVDLVSNSVATVEMWLHLDHLDKHRFFTQPLGVLPQLSKGLRSKILLFTLAVDKFCALVQVGLVIITVIFLLSLLLDYDLFAHPLPAVAYIVFEATVAGYCMLNIVRYAIFFVMCSLVGTLVYTGHVLELGRTARHLIDKYYRARVMTSSADSATSAIKHYHNQHHHHQMPYAYMPLKHQAFFRGHLHGHNLVCYLVTTGSEQLFSWVMFAFLATNVPVNVELIRRLTFNHLTTVDRILLGSIVAVQALAASVVIAPLAWCCSVYHSPARLVPTLQAVTTGPAWLLTKLKYEDLYGRLLSGRKIALGIGPLSAVTYLSGLELFIMYIGFILMAFKRQLVRQMLES